MQTRIPKLDKLPYQIYICNLSLSASAPFHDGMEANHIRSVGTLLGCYEIICPRSWGARNPHLITIYICRCWSTGDLASRNSNASPYTTFVFSYFPSLSTLARFPPLPRLRAMHRFPNKRASKDTPSFFLLLPACCSLQPIYRFPLKMFLYDTTVLLRIAHQLPQELE